MWFLMMIAAAAPPSERDARKESCNLGDAKECTSLAIGYLSGKDSPKDPIYAMDLFKKGCELGDSAACVLRADAYRAGNGVPKDSRRAVDIYTKACNEDFLARACRSLGDIYILGDGVERDPAFSSLYYGQGCAGGDGESCVGAALGLERGDFAEANPEKAREQLLRACQLLHGRGCSLVGERYLRGIGGPKDITAAALAFESGCSLQDAVSCRELGRLALKGKGIAKDKERARAVLTQACAWEDYEGCNDLADVIKRDDLEAAVYAAARACDLAYEPGCAKQRQLTWKLQQKMLREGTLPAPQSNLQ